MSNPLTVKEFVEYLQNHWDDDDIVCGVDPKYQTVDPITLDPGGNALYYYVSILTPEEIL